MSTAALVPETWELDGDDARETLVATGRTALARDAFVRLRYSDGFSHARSMAFLISLVLVQAVIGFVGLASWLGENGPGIAIIRTIEEVAPGAVGQTVSDAVLQAEAIIDTEVRDFMHWMSARGAVPAIRALRDQAERSRRHELDRALKALERGEDARKVIERLSEALTNKLMHPPTHALNAATEAEREKLAQTLARIYQIHRE